MRPTIPSPITALRVATQDSMNIKRRVRSSRFYLSLSLSLNLWSIALLSLTLTGCDRKSAKLRPLTPTEIQEQLTNHVGVANPEVQRQAADVAAALQSNRPVEAFDKARELLDRPGLGEEEREWVAQTFTTVMASLQKAADRGNKDAKLALEEYRATK